MSGETKTNTGVRTTGGRLSKRQPWFFLPVVLAGAFLNIGGGSGGSGTCHSWDELHRRRVPCSPRVLQTTREGESMELHTLPFDESYASNQPLAIASNPLAAASGDVLSVGWRGDPVLELELIAGPVFSRTPINPHPPEGPAALISQRAIDFGDGGYINEGYAIVWPWLGLQGADNVAQVDVRTSADSTFGITYLPGGWLGLSDYWSGAHTARIVDRGWCSGTISWDDVAESGARRLLPRVCEHRRARSYRCWLRNAGRHVHARHHHRS